MKFCGKNAKLTKQKVNFAHLIRALSNWFYADRAFGGNRHYRPIDVDIDAGTKQGKATNESSYMPVEYARMGYYVEYVYGRPQEPFLVRR